MYRVPTAVGDDDDERRRITPTRQTGQTGQTAPRRYSTPLPIFLSSHSSTKNCVFILIFLSFALSFDKIGGTSAIQKKIFAFLLVLRSVCTIFAIYRLKHCFFNQKHLFL